MRRTTTTPFWRIATTGGGTPEVVYDGLPNVRSIVIGDGVMYFNSTDTIYKAPVP